MLIRVYFLTLCFLLITIIDAKSGRRKGELKQPIEFSDWDGKWFPFDPKKPIPTTTTPRIPNFAPAVTKDELDNWNLKWFPFDPKRPIPTTTTPRIPNFAPAVTKYELDNWNLKWFPFNPSIAITTTTEKPRIVSAGLDNTLHPFKSSNMPISNQKLKCDNGQSTEIDFDPNDKRHSFNYLCLSSNRSEYEPNLETEAILEEQFIPPTFEPPIKCLNESINYESPLMTFGAFRPLPPKYGSYFFLPPQRWLHSIAEGGIVMLYHPCAFPGQVKLLRNTVQSCLYRHIITPNQNLSPQRPLALLAWGKILQMSVVDEKLVVDFIKSNAKHGPIPMGTKFDPKGSYEIGLLSEAKLITDIEDIEICGYKEM